MTLNLDTRDLIIGVAGTLLGGVVVWLITKNIELGAQLKAIETINPQIIAAVSASSSADASAKEAIDRANEAVRNVKNAEKEVNRILTNINATPLFKKVDESIGELRQVASDVAKEELKQRVDLNSTWPHAINCGSAWDALYMLHGNPTSGTELAYYVQVYPNEYRNVRFNPDGSFHDRAGHSESSLGCEGKSIDQLRQEHRTYQFLSN